MLLSPLCRPGSAQALSGIQDFFQDNKQPVMLSPKGEASQHLTRWYSEFMFRIFLLFELDNVD